MATRTATQWTALDSALCDLNVAIAAERMKILLNPEREFGADLMAEVTGITTGIIEEIVMTGRAFDRVVIVMLEVYLQQRATHNPLFTPLEETICRGRDQNAYYKQGSKVHSSLSAPGT